MGLAALLPSLKPSLEAAGLGAGPTPAYPVFMQPRISSKLQTTNRDWRVVKVGAQKIRTLLLRSSCDELGEAEAEARRIGGQHQAVPPR